MVSTTPEEKSGYSHLVFSVVFSDFSSLLYFIFYHSVHFRSYGHNFTAVSLKKLRKFAQKVLVIVCVLDIQLVHLVEKQK